ncbi:MAG: type II toxin-antitoxin system HicA family toxin [Dehalococcoidia bacterium]|nr:type II toxin-antitoxin system HicA family toxin [Dehalococcoidia bacterium]
MSFPQHVWLQLKATTTGELVRALERDGFSLDEVVRTERIYRRTDGRKVSIHYHSKSDCYGPGLLKALLEAAGWKTATDLRRVGLIK